MNENLAVLQSPARRASTPGPQPAASPLRRCWFIAARSRDVAKEPVSRTILGERIVLFRDRTGRVAALEDRCVHRHVSLSGGTVRDGRISCPYHGWQFDASGQCVGVPCAADGERMPRRKVRRLHSLERDGSVWVCLADTPDGEPPTWRRADEPPRGAWFELETRVACPMQWVLDNFVDCGHTGFVHAGLFRDAPERTVRAEVSETPTGVRIETFGENDLDSVLGRLLVRRGERVRHLDELVLPHTVRVDYLFGTRAVRSVSICTPEDADTTRIFTRVYIAVGRLSAVVSPVVEVLTRRILAQDKRILEDQAAQIRAHGDRFGASCAADVPTAFVSRAFSAFCRGQFPPARLRSRSVEYRL